MANLRTEPVALSTSELPKPPKHLSAEAGVIWTDSIAGLVSRYEMIPADMYLFGEYCRLAALCAKWGLLIETSPPLLPGPRGVARANPAVEQYRKFVAELNKVADKFGLNPHGRVRLEGKKSRDSGEDDGWETFDS